MNIIININNEYVEGLAPTVYITFFYRGPAPKKLSYFYKNKSTSRLG